jgi:hypothetical protein
MADFSSFFPETAAAGGGAIPETSIFDTAGKYKWIVPTNVKNEIAAEGHAEVGLLMVGGGSDVDNQSGEVISELYPLSTSDYDPASSWATSGVPEITIQVGNPNEPSGITLAPASPAFLDVGYGGGTGNSPNGSATYSQTATTVEISGTEFALVSSITFPSNQRFNSGSSGFTFDAVPTATGFTDTSGNAITPTITPSGISVGDASAQWTVTFPGGAFVPFNGTLAATYRGFLNTFGSYQPLGVFSVQKGSTAQKISNTNPTNFGGSHASTSGIVRIKLADSIVKQARSGNNSSTITNSFPNLNTSTDGFLGFSRSGSTRPGSANQKGYVQIFHS